MTDTSLTSLAFCLLLLATGASAQENVIQVERDSHRGVTCYILNHVGISCVPDSQLQAQAEQQQDLAGEHYKTPTPATAPGAWSEERYSL